jgi:quinol monooxygenase YgiN
MTGVLVVTRYRVPEEESDEFAGLARAAVAALSARPGCVEVRFGRNTDEPDLWVLASSWQTVGVYRRALSHPDVKVNAVPLMYRCIDEPTAFEDLITWAAATGTTEHASDLR